MANLQSLLTSVRAALGHFYHTSRKIAAPIVEQFEHFSQLCTVDEDEVERLRSRLRKIRDLLKQADNFIISGDSNKHWLSDLRDIEYCLEDVIEEIEFEVLRATTLDEFRAELIISTHQKKKHDISLLYFPSPSCSLKRKIQRIWEKYQEIAYDRQALSFVEGDCERRPRSSPLKPSSSLTESPLHGRKSDMEHIIKVMLSDNDDGRGCNYSVIPIFGMAGVGKTTFVQHLYKNEIIADKFDLKIWVWVSQNFDVQQITSQIVEQISNYAASHSGFNKLHNIIKEKLVGRRFLLVLDDLWIEDQDSWESLKVPLNFGAKGSKVLVTTRSKGVAKMICPEPYRLSCLSDDDCWAVCEELIPDNHNIMKDSSLLEISKKLIHRCRGLPLAAKAVGGLLRQSLDRNHWHDVSENCFWIREEMLNQVMPAIKVSYDYLPLHLKRCFAYCSLFPKGHAFYKHEIVKLWMALGYVVPGGACNPEYTGYRYFDELVDRCFFECSPFHDIREERYIMHDLYHDLAEHVSGNEFSRVEGYKLSSVDRQTRHSSLAPLECHSERDIQFYPSNGQYLRSFLFLGNIEHKPDKTPFGMNVSLNLFEILESLRVLDLSNTDIKELPDSIGYLIHLRYLSLQNSKIQRLPETICGLFNLQSINMKHCSDLIELPSGMKLLSKLQNLELPTCANLWMPSGFDQLTSLRMLSLFVVGCDPAGSQLQELGSMINLGGELILSGLNNVSDPQHAEEANLLNKEKLEKITLKWGNHDIQFDVSLKEKTRSKVLQCLQPNPHLKDLSIDGFFGAKFPTWLGDDCLSKLTTLELKNCGLSDKLPSLGRLPALKHLCIQSMPRLECVGLEFCGYPGGSSGGKSESRKGFRALETLKFSEMVSWKEWVDVEETDFPNLRYLSIIKCHKLRHLPAFTSVVNVQIMHCEQLSLKLSYH